MPEPIPAKSNKPMGIIFTVVAVILLISSLFASYYFSKDDTTTSSSPPSSSSSMPTVLSGNAISCTGYNPKGVGAIYRYDGNRTMRWYPNPQIAASWDSDWASGTNRQIDCTGFTLGNDIQLKVVSGRYIKLSNPTVGCMNLAEIEVYSTDGGPNIANTATITKSSGFGGDQFPVGNFVDGNNSNFVHTSCNDAPWIQLDFGRMIPISKIVLRNRQDCCQERINGLVLTILDNSNNVVYTANPISQTHMVITYTTNTPNWIGST